MSAEANAKNEIIRIANFSAFYGDRLSAAREIPGLDEEVKTKLNRLLIPLPPHVPGFRKSCLKEKSETQ